MGVKEPKGLPFAVARSSRATLVEQVVEGLRRCILSGFYKPGDILPTTRDLAMILGVSRIVTRTAVRELTKAGLINPKPSVGCVVLGRRGKLWRGNVLFVQRSNGRTYYVNVFTASLRARLVKAGWLFTQVTMTPDAGGKVDTSELELHLTHPVTLAVVMFDNPRAESILSRSGVPFVSLGSGGASRRKGCLGRVRYDRAAAAAELAAAAAAAGVKTALQVGWENFDDVGAAFRKAGIRSSSWNIAVPPCGKKPESVSFAVRDAIMKWLSSHAKSAKCAKGSGMKKLGGLRELCARETADFASEHGFPDLIYFSDDHACSGALAALAAAGVRVPEDVRIATWSNLGNGPVFSKKLARLEIDPEGDAEKFAAALLAHLEGLTDAFALTLIPAFRKGETL